MLEDVPVLPSYAGPPVTDTGRPGTLTKVFLVDPMPDLPCRLAPGEALSLDVTYRPNRIAPHTGEVIILSNDDDEPGCSVLLEGEGILEAVNAGGDTDTIAAMVGAMIGCNVGLEGIPEEWLRFRPEFQKALMLGEQLFQVMKK